VHLGEHLDRANLVAPMANAERLIPYLEQLLRYPFHIGRDLLLDFFFRGLLQLVDNFLSNSVGRYWASTAHTAQTAHFPS
jgi:hypothetical protein